MLSPVPPAPTRLGVLGWPVAHSLSPAIQNAALSAVGLDDWRYQRLPVPPGRLAETVSGLPGAGFRGVNVTIPHKTAALALADTASRHAVAIGAANTLLFGPGGSIRAENTDAPALIALLPAPASGASALVLGAGGSARAAVWALLHAGAGSVKIWNRTPERARALCAELGGTPTEAPEPADLLINCTTAGLEDGRSLASLPLDAAELAGFGSVIDFVYRPGGTELTRAAHAQGCRVVDGLELLVGQGALSFELFTGRQAPAGVMLPVAREAAGPDGGYGGDDEP